MSDHKRTCETCFFWSRIVHMLDFEIGRCQLFEREQRAPDHCSMWDGRAVSAATSEDKSQAGMQKPLG